LIRLNILLVVLFSLLFLGERLDAWQWLGVAAALAAMLLLSRQWARDSQGSGRSSTGLLLVGLAMLCGALSSITCKFAAVSVNTLAFIGLSYVFSTLFVLAVSPRMFTARNNSGGRLTAAGIGLVMGVINLAGFYAFLRALSTGPLSLVASINGLHFIVAVILSRLIYRERITPAAGWGLVLTVASLVLLRGS
jgi:drug/metabolite transporter (DMT)-like permease